MRIRELIAADHEPVLRLNNAALPAVSELDADSLSALVAMADLVLVAEDDGQVIGFAVVLAPGADYASDNYRWFTERYADFRYLDRIVVAPAWRGTGLGTRLHAAVAEHARTAGAAWVTLEVNLEPPNPGSLRFHRRLEFEQVDTFRGASGKLVSMMVRRP